MNTLASEDSGPSREPESVRPGEELVKSTADKLLSAFLTYRYDIDVKPEHFYSAHDRAALLHQIRWHLFYFLARTEEQSAKPGAEKSAKT